MSLSAQRAFRCSIRSRLSNSNARPALSLLKSQAGECRRQYSDKAPVTNGRKKWRLFSSRQAKTEVDGTTKGQNTSRPKWRQLYRESLARKKAAIPKRIGAIKSGHKDQQSSHQAGPRKSSTMDRFLLSLIVVLEIINGFIMIIFCMIYAVVEATCLCILAILEGLV